jgi:hypothetical protein
VGQLAEHSWSHLDYSPLITSGSAGREQLLTVLLLSTHHQWVSWQRAAGHTSVTLHSSPVDQMAEHSWSHFDYSPLLTRRSAGREQLVTLLLLSSHLPWIRWQSTAGHTFVTLHSSPVDQMAEHSWSHFCYSPLITRRSAGTVLLVTLRLLSTQHPCVSWKSTAGHTSVTLHSSPVDQLTKHSWSHFCYSPLITRGSAGRSYLVTLLLLSTHHPWINWQITAGHTSVTPLSSPVCQLAEHTGHTSITLHSTPVCQLEEHSWSLFCYSPLITCGSAARVQLVTLRLLSTYHPCISWQSTAGHTSATLHS